MPASAGSTPGEALEQRGLAGAVRPDQAEDFAVADRQRDALERGQAAVAFGEAGGGEAHLRSSNGTPPVGLLPAIVVRSSVTTDCAGPLHASARLLLRNLNDGKSLRRSDWCDNVADLPAERRTVTAWWYEHALVGATAAAESTAAALSAASRRGGCLGGARRRRSGRVSAQVPCRAFQPSALVEIHPPNLTAGVVADRQDQLRVGR